MIAIEGQAGGGRCGQAEEGGATCGEDGVYGHVNAQADNGQNDQKSYGMVFAFHNAIIPSFVSPLRFVVISTVNKY